MSLEQAIVALTAAVENNTIALKAGGGSSTGSSSTQKSTEQKHTRAEMQAALQGLKEAKDAAAAKAVIKEAGGVEKMDKIPDDKIDAVFDAAKKAMPNDDM